LGPKGSFTHQAAQSRFGAMSSYIAINSIKGVFREVANKKAKFGIIPIENSSNGIVSDTITSLQKYDLKIISEVIIDIHHCLATTAENIEDIQTVYSKDIAFEQCYQFLNDFGLDNQELIPVESTAKAAKIAKEIPNTASICSSIGAKMYNLPILFENIEDDNNNKTRFLIISDFENQRSGNDKTSILATLPNTTGALVEFLNDFYKYNINLTKIKSHIIGGISSFFIDFDGHKDDENIQKIFQKHQDSIQFLGSYVKEADDI
jgi:chorismate mutase/prephenate dehydratase